VARLVVAALVALPVLASARPASADPIASKQAEAQRLSNQIAALSLRQSRLAEAYDAALLRVNDLNTKMATARAGLGATGSQLDSARSRVRNLAVSSYMRGGTAVQLGMFVPRSAQDLTVRNTYMRTIAAGTNGAIDALRAAHAQLGDEQATLAADQAAAAKALAQADGARRAAAAADASERATLAKVRGELTGLVAAADAQRRAATAARLQAEALRSGAGRASRNGGSGGRGAPVFDPGPLPPPPPGASGAVEEARRQLGKPYVYGGGGPDGYDCSGLTAWAWGHAGRSLPHSAAAQFYATTHIPVSQLEPGDLVFYGSPPHHVGIYVGGGQMINALHSGTNVEYDSIYIEGDLIGGGRVN
jgi:cell wall-associated NlpC family hydrolase